MCTAQKVNRESFLLLKEDDLKEMLPLVGPRTKFLKKGVNLRYVEICIVYQ